MEKRGIATEKGTLNRWIKDTNKMILDTEQKVSALKNWVSENRQSSLIQSLNAYNSMRNAGAYSQTAKVTNLKELTDDINFLKANGIETFEELQDKLSELNEKIDGFKEQSSKKSARLKEIDNLLIWAQHYAENKPVADELAKPSAKNSKPKMKMPCGFIIWQNGNFTCISRTASCQSAHGKQKNCKCRKILRKYKIIFRRCAMMSKGFGKSNIKSNRQTTIQEKKTKRKGKILMKFNKNGEKPEIIKSKRNIRFDENGHIIVQDPLYNVLPTVTITIESKGTTYRFTGSYDGEHSLPAKILKNIALYSDKGVENDE